MYHAQNIFHVYTVKMYVSLWESFDKDLRNSYFDKFYPMEPSPILQKIADTDEVFLWVWRRGIILVPLIFILIRACVHYALFEDEFYMKSQIETLKETLELFIAKYNPKARAGTVTE